MLADDGELERVFIGLYDGLDSASGKSIQKAVARMLARRERNRKRVRGTKVLSVEYYDSKTAHVWD